MSSSSSSSRLFVTPGLAREVMLQQRAHFMRFIRRRPVALLWSQIRGRPLGVSFRWQVAVGSYIVDFMASAAGLVVEVDGDGYHAERTTADDRRDEALRRAGYRVLRLPASMVERRLREGVALVRVALLR